MKDGECTRLETQSSSNALYHHACDAERTSLQHTTYRTNWLLFKLNIHSIFRFGRERTYISLATMSRGDASMIPPPFVRLIHSNALAIINVRIRMGDQELQVSRPGMSKHICTHACTASTTQQLTLQHCQGLVPDSFWCWRVSHAFSFPPTYSL